MKRRDFLSLAGTILATGAAPYQAFAAPRGQAAATEAAKFRAARRFAELPFGRIAYVDRGAGPQAALFLHGAPLNSFQWRGAFDRPPHRRNTIDPAPPR